MLYIHLREEKSSATMMCSNFDVQQSGISAIRLTYYFGQSIDFSINVTDAKAGGINQKLHSISNSTTCTKAAVGYTISLNIAYTGNLYLFNQAIAVLRKEITVFDEIDARLPELIQANKAVVLRTNQLHHQDKPAGIESDVDNNQRASVFASARTSELLLRQQFNFPNPRYTDAAEAGIAFDPRDPEAAAIAAAIMVADQEDYDHAEHDISKYSVVENQLIDSLIAQLKEMRADLVARDYLVSINPANPDSDAVLSVLSEDLISAPAENDQILWRQDAHLALNVITSLRALAPGGSHSHNGAMVQTKIRDYGMRNIVALMYKCYLESSAYDESLTKEQQKPNCLSRYVTYYDVFAALVSGIADGARGKNRNKDTGNDSGIDDLAKVDQRVCDKGRFNALIAAFNGILPKVEIIYEITDLLLNELKREILLKLIHHNSVKNIDEAEKYLHRWLGNMNIAVNIRGYNDFERRVKAAFPVMKTEFLEKVCAHVPYLKKNVSDELDREIANVEAQSFGFSYIESVSPAQNQLRQLWSAMIGGYAKSVPQAQANPPQQAGKKHKLNRG